MSFAIGTIRTVEIAISPLKEILTLSMENNIYLLFSSIMNCYIKANNQWHGKNWLFYI